jgi:murein DD-endopeptidase MepM/ murein hydrolase activator NlpD
MSPVRHPLKAPIRRRPPHRVIIARGEHIRTFTIRPWLIGAVFALASIVTAAYLGATGYLVFRDDLLATSIARQSSMQHAYEDRIASLRADIDRLTSRQLLNQQEVEAEVQKLVSRQATISERQDALAGLNDAARAAGIAATKVVQPPAPQAAAPAAAKPNLKTGALVLPSIIDTAEAAPTAVAWKPPLARISEVEADIDRVAIAQMSYVNALAANVVGRNEQIAAILKGIGRSVPAARPQPSNIGGPFVPAPASSDPVAFKTGVAMVQGELARYSAIRTMAARLPLSAPVADPSLSSGFGTRVDPFLGTPALHTGVDFRALQGMPVAATAPGTVVAADIGYNGGYGNMVDIDHGNGIVTRFGHLSEISVKVGQVVGKGTIIGRAGATGRATGPHVHYEVRIDDDPIDPTRFLNAGDKLIPLL